MSKMIKRPCVCNEGEVEVHNAWSENPLESYKEFCDICFGAGFFLIEELTEH